MFLIKVKNLIKSYHLYNSPVDRLKEALHPFRKKYYHDFFALKDISFEIKKGETVGIIGKNGSGKSTLLKILAGVMTQTNGSVTVNGNVSALLELGGGFNPEFTGLENIYFSSSIMGYSKKQIDLKLDEIIEFADIGEFINQPVKTYSSGMFVRLAFAVAVNVDPEILIIDEALSVGDMRFQQKCFRKINDFKDKGKSIILVTHDTGNVINFCDRAIWLENGKILYEGDSEDTVKRYMSYMVYDNITEDKKNKSKIDIKQPYNDDIKWEDISACSSFGEGGAEIEGVAFYLQKSFEKINVLKCGEEVTFCIKLIINTNLQQPGFGILIKDRHGNPMFTINNYLYNRKIRPLLKDEIIILQYDFLFPHIMNGQYTITTAISDGTQMNHIQHHWIHDSYCFQIANNDLIYNAGYLVITDDFNIKLTSL